MTTDPMDNSNSTNHFFLLPSLIRDEIYSHIFPQTKAIWLGRKAASPYDRVQASGDASLKTMDLYQVFWRRRQLEHLALSHWYPRETGFTAMSDMYPQMEGYMYARNGDEALRAFLALRLVCHQMCVEASTYLFRTATLWWTVWDAEVALIRELICLEEEHAEIGPRNNNDVGKFFSCLPGRPYGYEQITQTQWKDFIQRRKDEGLLRWISQFRRINIVIQEAHVLDAFDIMQAILRISPGQQIRLPAFHFVVCGFKLYFDQVQNHWETYRPGGKSVAEYILDVRWDGAGSGAKASEKEALVVDKISKSEGPTFWSSGDSAFWLDALKFCNIPFRADARFGESKVDLTGKLIFYTPKGIVARAETDASA